MASREELQDLPVRLATGATLVLRPSWRRKLFNLVLGLVAGLVFVGALGAVLGVNVVVGLIVLVPSLFFTGYWLLGAMPRSSSLVLTRTGFTARHLFIGRSWDWDDVVAFGLREIVYPRAGAITLVSFTVRGGHERSEDLLQELGVRGITRTTTLPDAYGSRSEDLAAAMERCRERFVDGVATPHDPRLATDVRRSHLLNAGALLVLGLVLTAGAVLVVREPEDTFSQVLGWVGIVLFGACAVMGLVQLLRPRRTDVAPREIDAELEIAHVASATGTDRETVQLVLERHYAYLADLPSDQVVVESEVSAWIASRTGVSTETVAAILSAQLDFLREAGLVEDALEGRR